MKKRVTGLIIALLVSLPASATWFEVTGQAAIQGNNTVARNNALKDAVFQAMQYAGADLSAFNHFVPHLEKQQNQYLFSSNEVRAVDVVKTRRSNGVYYVTARVDIYPTAKTCHKTQYKKSVLLSRFHLNSPQQASLGAVFKLADDFTDVLHRQLNQQSQSFISPAITAVNISPSYPLAATMLAEDNDAQFVIRGELTDLTATVSGNEDTLRQFAAFVQVMDGNTGEVLFQRDYRDAAIWPFARTSKLDTRSARFWQSSYGEMVIRVSRQMLLDLENQLSCRTTLPEIVNQHRNMAQINVGRIHGVKSGDQLQLWHRAVFIDQNGISRHRMVKSELEVTVDRVYESSAEVIVSRPELAASIQIGDIVTKIVNGNNT
ncbi:flagellar assembly protein T N-terminal domain-containing protein [Thaumasiovibrio sp. DFM-14]|uniref:flagella assembly protein FlgT n=1 Tax=Thaumasiovibrio sp. DFM-14 TaxID=3384792 RepID=UPI0039A287BC